MLLTSFWLKNVTTFFEKLAKLLQYLARHLQYLLQISRAPAIVRTSKSSPARSEKIKARRNYYRTFYYINRGHPFLWSLFWLKDSDEGFRNQKFSPQSFAQKKSKCLFCPILLFRPRNIPYFRVLAEKLLFGFTSVAICLNVDFIKIN